MTDKSFEAFFAHMLATALWSSTDESDNNGGEPLDANYGASDFAPESLEELRADALRFYSANSEHIHCDDAPTARDFRGSIAEREAAMAGHDFWLTRCGHGAGFWDGDWPESVATILSEAAEAFGNVDLYVGDDGQVHS